MDDHGHGTHVASIAAGKDVLNGVAPDAKIVAYKVCSANGNCPESMIIAAIERAVDPNQDGNFDDAVDVISISLGSDGTPDDPDSLAVDAAVDAGVFVTVSAGNLGSASETITCPACARKAVSVAAWCNPNLVIAGLAYCTSPIATFSSRGPVIWNGETLDKPEISAPGARICAAQLDDSYVPMYTCPEDQYVYDSGTSMAAPHVAGAAALIKQAHPNWSPLKIKDAILETAVDQNMDKYAQGAGLIDLLAAVGYSETAPLATISTSGKLVKTVDITGIASGVNFTGYELSYGQGIDPVQWNTISQSTDPVVENILGQWNTLDVMDDQYSLKLIVSNSLGEDREKIKIIEVDNVRIDSPEADSWPNGNLINIEGSVTGAGFRNYVIEYSLKDADQWSASGIALVGGGSSTKEDELLGIFNTDNVGDPGIYTIRLTAEFNGNKFSSEEVDIHLGDSIRDGFPVDIGYDIRSSPVPVDIDNDGEKEIIIGTGDGNVYAINHDGTIVDGWPVFIGDFIGPTPAVADLDGDGYYEVVVASRKYYKLYVFNHDGTHLDGFPIRIETYASGSPAIGDVDGNGDLEIVIGTMGVSYVYAINHDGTFLNNWPHYQWAQNIRATPAVADIDNDNKSEVIIPLDQRLFVLDEHPENETGFPVDIRPFLPGFTYMSSNPVVGDIDGDGDLEIVHASQQWVYAWHADGSLVSGWPVNLVLFIHNSPALGDIDNDGKLEIIINELHNVYALNDDGTTVNGWPKHIGGYDIILGADFRKPSPAIVDIDNDGEPEILVGEQKGMQEGVAPKLYAFNGDGTDVEGWPKTLPLLPDETNVLYSSPAIDDLDNDGTLEIIMGYKDGKVYVWNTNVPYDFRDMHWNQFQHDIANTGLYSGGSYVEGYEEKYLYFTLTGDDCNVNLTLTATTDDKELYVRLMPNMCDNNWDQNMTVPAGQTDSMILDGLNHGSYAIMIGGVGAHTLTTDLFCRLDANPPSIEMDDIPPYLNEPVQLHAIVGDNNGLTFCEICIANDNLCDTEWTTDGLNQSFIVGDLSGTCSYFWNVTNYTQANYTVSIRISDMNNNTVESPSQHSIVDLTGPSINILAFPPIVDALANFTLTADVSDNFGVNYVNISIFGQTLMMQRVDPQSTIYNIDVIAPDIYGEHLILLNTLDHTGNLATANYTINVEELISWSEDAVLTSGADDSPSVKPHIVVDTANNRHIVWEENNAGNSEIYYSKIDAVGKLIIHNHRISNNLYNSYNPQVATDPSNNAHIVWVDDRDGNKEIYYSKLSSNGDILISEMRVTHNLFESIQPAVFASGESVDIVWLDDRSGNVEFFFKKIDQAGAYLISDKQISSDLDMNDFSVVQHENIIYIVYKKSTTNEIRLIRINRENGNLDLETGLIYGFDPSVSVSVDLCLAWLLNDNVVFGRFTKEGILLSTLNITSNGSATSPEVSCDQENKAQLLWLETIQGAENLYYIKLDQNNVVIRSQMQITDDVSGVSDITLVSGSAHITYQTDNESHFITTNFDETAPLISSISVDEITPYTARVTWTTDEASTSLVNFGIFTANDSMVYDESLTLEHSVIIGGLFHQTDYKFEVISSDLFGNKAIANNNGHYYTFTTGNARYRPALPTTFYGRVVFTNGTPAQGVPVNAHWADTNTVDHNTLVSSMTIEDAIAMGNLSLVGYYFFSSGEIKAKPGTMIFLSSPGDITEPNPFIPADPGGSPSLVVGGPIMVDTIPPEITIHFPQEDNYITPFLYLNYSVNEEIQWAAFELNDQDLVTITDYQYQRINITANLGQNTLIVYATDVVGLGSSESVTFWVNDSVAPAVTVNAPPMIFGIFLLSADVFDLTNPLKPSCEICISTDGVCDSEWSDQDVANDFMPGDYDGRCLFEWDTSDYDDMNFIVNFRVQDQIDNWGTGQAVQVTVDNNAPELISNLNVFSVGGQNLLSVSWTPSSDSNLALYNLYRSVEPFNDVTGVEPLYSTTANWINDTGLESGATFYYAVTAVDTAGNENKAVVSKNGTVADTVKPIVTITSPTVREYANQVIPLTYETSESVAWCNYVLNEGPDTPVSETINAYQGNNSLILSCADIANNVGTAEVDFVVDSVAPDPIFSIVVYQVPGEDQLLLDWGSSQEMGVLYKIYRSSEAFNNVQNMTPISSTYVDLFWDDNLVSGATYHYAVTAVDSLGNENYNVVSANGTVDDVIGPEIEIISPVNQLYETNQIDLIYRSNEVVTACTYNLNNEISTIYSNYTTITAAEGLNNLLLICNDTSDNTGFDSVQFNVDNEVPSQIVGLNVESVSGQNQLSLSWLPSDAPDIASYNIYRSENTISNIQGMTAIANSLLPSYIDIGLESEATYHYAVTAVDDYDNEKKQVSSVLGTVADYLPPEPVAEVVVEPSETEHSIQISWQATDASDFSHYNIYRSSSPWILIDSVQDINSVSYTDVNLTNGATYQYKVTVVDNSGNEETQVDSVGGTVADLLPPVITITAPLNQTPYNSRVVELAYDTDEPVASCSYSLNYAEALPVTPTINANEGQNSIKVLCTDLSGNPGESEIMLFNTDTTAPAPVTGLTVESIPQKAWLDLSWDDSVPGDLKHYNIYRSDAPFSDVSLMTPIGTSQVSMFTDMNLVSEATYYYGITAVDIVDNENKTLLSESGTVADVVAPDTITGLVVETIPQVTSLSLSWDPSVAEDFQKYIIYRANKSFSDVSLDYVNDQGQFYSTTDMRSFRRDLAITELHDGRVLIVGGYWSSAIFGYHWLKSTELYTLPETYEGEAGSSAYGPYMNQIRRNPSATTMQDGKVLIVGGLYQTHRQKSAEVFDPDALEGQGLFTILSEECGPQHNHLFHTVTVLPDGKVLIAGGYTDKAEIYNPATGCFEETGDLVYDRDGHEAVLLNNGKVFLAGDNIRCEIYDPAAGNFIATSTNMTTNRRRQATSILADGRVLLAGGKPGGTTAEIYDPVTDTFTETSGQLNGLRTGADAYLLENGKVLILGGLDYDDTYLNTAELFDPVTETFTMMNQTMFRERAYHDSIKLSDGRVFIAGGALAGTKSTEIYDPGDFVQIEEVATIDDQQQTSYTDTGRKSSAEHYYAVTAVDMSENENQDVNSVMGTVADIEPPVITITSPTDQIYDVSDIPLTYETDEEVASCTYSLNNAAYNPVAPTVAADEGVNNLTVSCLDLAGNQGWSFPIAFDVDTTAPEQILGLAVSPVPREASLNLAWFASGASDLDHYNIYRSSTPFADISSMQAVATTQNNNFLDVNLTNEATYHYAVTAVDLIGNELSDVISISGTVADIVPPVITILNPVSVVYGTRELILSYIVNEDVISCTYSLNAGAVVEVDGNTTFLASEGSNTIAVNCTDMGLNIGSAFISFDVDMMAPEPVQDLVVEPVAGQNSLLLSWRSNVETDIAEYNIYKSDSPFSNVLNLTPLDSSPVNTYQDNDLISMQTYYYAVTAVDQFDNENFDVTSVAGTVADTIPPAQVQGLQVLTMGDKIELNISWIPNGEGDLSHYKVYRSKEPFDEVNLILLIANATINNYQDINLDEGTTYYYAVTAVDDAGNEETQVAAVSKITPDITPPEVEVNPVGSRIAGNVTLFASVGDAGIGLLQSCAVCLTTGEECSWTTDGVVNGFDVGAINGTCSFLLDTSDYAEGVYTYTFRVSDLANNSRQGIAQQTEIVAVDNLTVFNMELTEGWNLMSIPLDPLDNSIEAVLNSLEGKYSKVYYFNPNNEKWMVYNPRRTIFHQPNDLLELEPGKGYWIEMSETATFTISGLEVVGFNIQLQSGWNYIGYPYDSDAEISSALETLDNKFYRIYSYNAPLDNWNLYARYSSVYTPNTLDTMSAGKGYLIDMINSTKWEP